LVRHVDLSYNEISDIGIEIFAKYIERCPNIVSLNLQGNNLTAPSAERLSTALAASESIKYLNLQYNKIGTPGAIVPLSPLRASPKTCSSQAASSKAGPSSS
jgi:Leucine-rich repeat (LRR) protein